MKIKSLLILTLAFAGLNLNAQTNAPTSPADFLSNVGSWLTSNDTNQSWNVSPFDLWSAANFQGGLQTSVELGGSYDLWSLSTNVSLAPEAVFRNANIAGTIVSGAGGIGLSYKLYAIKFTPYVDFGYSPSLSKAFGEVGLRIKKKMTVSTYTGIGIDYDVYFSGKQSSTPGFTAFVGWTF
jgi:hypothetical protein